MIAYPPLKELLPHSGPALLLEGITHYGEDCGSVSGRVHADAPYFREGRFARIWQAEIIAQAAGALVAYKVKTLEGLKATTGFVIAIDHFECAPDVEFRPGDTFVVHIDRIHDMRPLGQCDGHIEWRGRVAAKATIKLYADPERRLPSKVFS